MDLELQRELQGGSGALGVVDPWGLSLELDCVTPVGLALRVPKMLINVNKKTLRVAANQIGEFWGSGVHLELQGWIWSSIVSPLEGGGY